MIFNIKITDIIIIDLRNISIICAGIFGGPFSTMIAAVIIALFIIAYFGINAASIVSHFVTVCLGIGIAYISIIKLSRRNKYIFMFLLSMAMSSMAFAYLITDRSKLLETMVFYWSIYIFGAVLIYFTSEYIILANSNFKNMLYYRMTADNLSDMISTHEPGGKFKFVSPSVQQLFGFTQDELIGESIYKYVHPQDIKSVEEIFSKTLYQKDISTQIFRMRRRDGRYIWVESSMKITKNDDGLINEFICVTRDISIRK